MNDLNYKTMYTLVIVLSGILFLSIIFSEKSSNDKLTLTGATILGTTFILYIINEYAGKKWSCIEGTCEKVLGGEHNNLSECTVNCEKKELKSYNCNSQGQCEEVSGTEGNFTTLESCNTMCSPTSTETTFYYYDPLFYPYYSYYPYGGYYGHRDPRRRRRRRRRIRRSTSSSSGRRGGGRS